MLAIVRGLTLLILEVKGQGHNGHFLDKLVNTIETKPSCISSSNLAEMLTLVRGWTLSILEVRGQGQGHSGHVWKEATNQIKTKPLCASASNLVDMLTTVNPIDFGGHSSKMKVSLTNVGCAGMLRFALLYLYLFLCPRIE